MLIHAAGGQAHGQTDTLLNDGALQEDVLAQFAFLTGDDGVRDLAHQVVGLLALDVGVSHAGNLGKHLTADLNDCGIDSSKTHSNLSLFRNRKHPVLHWTAAGGICFAPGRLVPRRCNRRSVPDIQFHFIINGPA